MVSLLSFDIESPALLGWLGEGVSEGVKEWGSELRNEWVS